MNTKELNTAFLDACSQCPQFVWCDEDSCEFVQGALINVVNLHEQGVNAVLQYWNNPKTVGGHIIHNMGYKSALPDNVIKLLDSLDDIIRRHIQQVLSQE